MFVCETLEIIEQIILNTPTLMVKLTKEVHWGITSTIRVFFACLSLVMECLSLIHCYFSSSKWTVVC